MPANVIYDLSDHDCSNMIIHHPKAMKVDLLIVKVVTECILNTENEMPLGYNCKFFLACVYSLFTIFVFSGKGGRWYGCNPFLYVGQEILV